MKTGIILFCLFFCFISSGRVYINVGQAKIKKSLLALTPFIHRSSNLPQQTSQYGKEIFNKVRKNLESSGYFQLIPSGAFVENPMYIAMEPYPDNPRGFRWENWRIIGTEFLMFTRYSVENEIIKLRVYMYNVLLRRVVFQKEYKAPISKRHFLAHIICNDIIEHLTKKAAIFLTKIAFIRNTKGNKKELFIMDWDGSNVKQISFHRSIVISPAWTPSGEKLAYTAFLYRRSLKGRRANVLVYDFAKKRRRVLSSYYGTNLGSDFFPSGKEFLIALPSKIGGLDIFKYSLRRKRAFPILLGPKGAINVEPAIHPNGKTIVFSSNRRGKIMLYEMNQYGDNIRQITFTGSYNSSPSFSPDGRYIAFSGYDKGRFDLFLMDMEMGRKIRRLTSYRRPNGRWANHESPSFSPDGRQIVFVSDRSGRNQIYTIHIDGSNLKRLTFDKYNYKSPKWSPLIKRPF